jgi:hypothetical protein
VTSRDGRAGNGGTPNISAIVVVIIGQCSEAGRGRLHLTGWVDPVEGSGSAPVPLHDPAGHQITCRSSRVLGVRVGADDVRYAPL